MLKISYYFCLFLLLLGQFSILFKIGDSNIYAFDVVVILFGLFGFLYFALVKKTFKIQKSHLFFLIFSLIALVSLIYSLFKFNFVDILSGSMYLIRFVGYLLSGIVVFNMLKKNNISEKEFFYSIVISGVILGIGGIVQLILLPDFEVLDPLLGWDPHKYRLASSFFDPNFVGAYLSICIAFLFDKYYKSSEKKDFKKIDFVFFSFILVCLFLTFSRSAWAMLAVIVFIYGFFKSKTLLYVSLIVVFCAYFAVPRVQTRISGATDPADSARYRIESWKNAWEVSKDNLLMGVGFNNFKEAQRDLGILTADKLTSHSASGSDSSLLLILATTGIPGLLAYVAALTSNVFKKKKLDVFILAVTCGILVDSLFINSLFYPQIMFLLFSIYSFSRT